MSGNLSRKIFLIPVKLYQKLVSPFLGPNCIYTPTCSEYFNQAVMKHGIIKGSILGFSRIFRCNRLYMGGPDPVPETFSFKHIKNQRIAFRRHPLRDKTRTIRSIYNMDEDGDSKPDSR